MAPRVDGAPSKVQISKSDARPGLAPPAKLPTVDQMLENGMSPFPTDRLSKASLDQLGQLLPAAAASNQAITGTDAAGKTYSVRLKGEEYAVKPEGTYTAQSTLVDLAELTRMMKTVSVQPASPALVQTLKKHDAAIAAIRSQPMDQKVAAVAAFLKSEPNATPAQVKRWADAFTPQERQTIGAELTKLAADRDVFAVEAAKTEKEIKDHPIGTWVEIFNPVRAVGSVVAPGFVRPQTAYHLQGVQQEIGHIEAQLKSEPMVAKAKLAAAWK